MSFAPVSIRLPAAAADAILAVLPDDSSIGEWHREAVRQHLLREARRHVRAAEKRRQREAGQ
ncbi:MAG: hypothetical protein F4Y03_17965 [Alphaproteobacteria bacterium]|nr:hypothetical protein [Alphaproteobacteria bacterium]